VDDALSLIVKEGNRAGEVVERVRALIKKVPARKDVVAIDDAILEVIALTRAEAANNNVSVRTQFAEGLPRVQGDRVQLQQVMLNLIVQRYSGHKWCWGRRTRITDQHRCRPVRRRHARRGAGHRPGAEPGEPLASVRAILHDQARRHGHGPLDLPLDYRSAWWAAVGRPSANRRVLLFQFTIPAD